jgi:hypothetical protein
MGHADSDGNAASRSADTGDFFVKADSTCLTVTWKLGALDGDARASMPGQIEGVTRVQSGTGIRSRSAVARLSKIGIHRGN